ncbi:hypothetical protein RFI_26690 [Reticulomyxa filosa]|uniref:Uncharacterized protein n=1 Tax=Reticulomyxa filosa TaxID=46433 RepID=X6M9K6_RETFI|nr:hypothetical protein RFI_26690 [Reticulomyxa filosa]|eukprot:ETO10688.1 hypothetical protein RFI_26690 [Reticulomyxa filosa]
MNLHNNKKIKKRLEIFGNSNLVQINNVICSCLKREFFMRKFKHFSSSYLKRKIKMFRMKNTLSNEKRASVRPTLSEEEETQKIITYWIRVLHIKFGWIHEFDKLVVKYVMFFSFNLTEIKIFNNLFVFIIDNHYFNIGCHHIYD